MGDLKPCCADVENRSEPEEQPQPGLTMQRCTVCGRRHFELVADPGVFEMRSPEPVRP